MSGVTKVNVHGNEFKLVQSNGTTKIFLLQEWPTGDMYHTSTHFYGLIGEVANEILYQQGDTHDLCVAAIAAFRLEGGGT